MLNSHPELQVNIFNNNRGITKCQSFLHDADDNEAKAIVIPQVFSKNTQANKVTAKLTQKLFLTWTLDGRRAGNGLSNIS